MYEKYEVIDHSKKIILISYIDFNDKISLSHGMW